MCELCNDKNRRDKPLAQMVRGQKEQIRDSEQELFIKRIGDNYSIINTACNTRLDGRVGKLLMYIPYKDSGLKDEVVNEGYISSKKDFDKFWSIFLEVQGLIND